jgi:hypothetical protein
MDVRGDLLFQQKEAMSGWMCPIGRMEKVLMATDGSKASRNAVIAGLDLDKQCDSSLVVLSVAPSEEEI